MPFLAWSRAFTFVLVLSFLGPFAQAKEKSLFTSSVTYCSPPETLLIQRFEVAFFPSNSSVSFNVSASSVEKNVNVTANLFVNVYGLKPFNMTLDLCNILHGALCPLPMYNFTGADSITLPSSLDIASRIPGIAFVIPDLEGFAQLSLTEVNTGKVKACVQTTLSNGWSIRQEAVEWTTGGIALGGLVAAGAFSILAPEAIIPIRLLELISLYQTIASSALLNLNYPSVYRSFALNFAWALGLFPASPDSRFQQSINHMRHLTGGNLPDAGGSAVGLVNRKYSPFNSFVALQASTAQLLERVAKPVFRRAAETIRGEVQTVTAQSSNVLPAGIPVYVNFINVGTGNAFMTVFLVVLILLAITLGVLSLGFVIARAIRRRKGRTGLLSVDDYRSFAFSWFLRVAMVSFFPLLIFIFYQWTLKDSWLSIFLSVITFLVIAASIAYPSFRVLAYARKENPEELYNRDSRIRNRFRPLFSQYRSERYWFFAPVFGGLFLRAIFIAFAKGSGPAQIALLVAIELGLVIAHIALKPINPKGAHIFTSYLAVTRLVATGLLIAFIEAILVKPIPRVVIGIIIAIIWSVAALFTIGNIVWNIVLCALQRGNGREVGLSSQSSNGSMLEKGSKTPSQLEKSPSMEEPAVIPATRSNSHLDIDGPEVDTASEGRISRGRPVNPTPEHMHSVVLEPGILQPYPISPTGSTVSTMEDIPSIYSRPSSGTMTVGSLLPRRWSISMSQPGTPMSLSSQGHSSGGGYQASVSAPPTESTSGHGSNVSRNTSLRIGQLLQQRYEDIEEELESSPKLSRS
ncbi:hypothetical protein CPB83DRAFT_854369 [Crepidotus variabilis]|uniref:ML-like domain-containing protein n=1 Tax=Crepidotus variabilis TaxID=179855 RepID=A0A9P6JQG3_9AGAR|nr:hypothetical protein CPB83DRAFT_854369 [Crepidotus variabilis]